MLPKLLERSGTSARGTITGLYTVLVDGDDMNEPIADAVRSILDGHIVLSRDLAHAGHYPAVDVLASVSRLVGEVVTREVRSAGDEVRRLMAAYKEKSDLISIGAYQRGSDALTDAAIDARSRSTASSASTSRNGRAPRRPTPPSPTSRCSPACPTRWRAPHPPSRPTPPAAHRAPRCTRRSRRCTSPRRRSTNPGWVGRQRGWRSGLLRSVLPSGHTVTSR